MGNLNTWPLQKMIPGTINPIAHGDSKDIEKLKRIFNQRHMQEFIETFKWENLPKGINQDLIERILYFRFKGAFFEYLEDYYFLPFTLYATEDTGVDNYGRYKKLVPTIFSGSVDVRKEEFFLKQAALDTPFKIIYDKEWEHDKYKHKAVILTDSSLAISQEQPAPSKEISPIIDQMVDILVLVNIDLVTSAKVFYIVASNEAEKAAIENEFQNLDAQIMAGKRVVVVTSPTKLEELNGSQTNKDQQRYMQTFQSFDNLRRELIGLPNGGTFQKTEHQTNAEISKNTGTGNSLVIKNRLRMREEFCEIINAVFGLNVTVKINAEETDEMITAEGKQSKQLAGEGDE